MRFLIINNFCAPLLSWNGWRWRKKSCARYYDYADELAAQRSLAAAESGNPSRQFGPRYATAAENWSVFKFEHCQTIPNRATGTQPLPSSWKDADECLQIRLRQSVFTRPSVVHPHFPAREMTEKIWKKYKLIANRAVTKHCKIRWVARKIDRDRTRFPRLPLTRSLTVWSLNTGGCYTTFTDYYHCKIIVLRWFVLSVYCLPVYFFRVL